MICAKLLAISLLCLSLSGCAAKSAIHFSEKDVAKVHINPRYCVALPNGDLECHKDRVVLATIPAK